MKRIPAAGLIGAALREAAARELGDVLNLVRAAVAKATGRDYIDLDAAYPDHVVARVAGRYMSYPYTIGDDNQVQLGAPAEVARQHVAIREALAANESAALIEAVSEGSSRWEIRVIRAGESRNNIYYPDAVLREAAPLLEGARVFVKSDVEHIKGQGKDVRNLIGQITAPRFVEGKAPDAGEILGELLLIEPQGDVAVKMREAFDRHMSNLFGFSIDADGATTASMREGRKVRVAKRITKFHSVDLIVEPGAGGELIRMIEAVDDGNTTTEEQSEMTLRARMIEAIKAKNPQFDGASATDDQIETAYREAVAGGASSTDVDEVGERIRMIEARATARATIIGAKLPQPAKDRLLADFGSRERFVEADVATAIEAEREYLGRFTESGKPVIHFGDIEVEDRSKKIGEMFDDFFAGKNSAHSIKEAYIEATGDKRVTGRLENCDRTRLAEAVGGTFREAADSAQFANVLGNSIRRALLADYRATPDLDMWRKIANVVPLQDFRTNERTRFGGYGDLPVVPEKGDYELLDTPDDDKAEYAPAKRGGLEEVTLEAIKNDDVGLIRRIPIKMSRAAKRTLAKFVFDMLRTNPVVYDGKALFHTDHKNLFTGALNAVELSAHRLAMMKQVEQGSNDPLGIGPKYLLVPVDLQAAAADIFARATNLDKTFIQSLVMEILPVWYWTDANDWYTAADPLDIPGIEVGFLDGQEEPDLFVQDLPNAGSLFSNDVITYKVRHIYGGTVTDASAFTKAVVA